MGLGFCLASGMGLGAAWPALGQQALYQGLGRVLEKASRWALVGLVGVWLAQALTVAGDDRLMKGLGLGSVMSAPYIETEEDEQGWYHVRLGGEFELHLDGQVALYKRLLIIFLGLLEVPGESRTSRRTRDGRTPFVRQQQLAAWFGVPQPDISRWSRYWLQQDWRRMLNRRGETCSRWSCSNG